MHVFIQVVSSSPAKSTHDDDAVSIYAMAKSYAVFALISTIA